MPSACLVAGLAIGGTLSGQQCRTCHPREADQHAASAHAHSIQPVLESSFYHSLPLRPIGEARGGVLFTYQPDGEALRITAQRDTEVASASIQWVFGAGRQAETPLVVQGPTYLEHRLSYYVAAGRFDLTMGHARGISSSPQQALGRPLAPEEARRCFACHTTADSAGSSGPGVQCESCHTGAKAHARGSGAVGNPGRMNARDLVKFCAACHRNQAEGDPDDSINVRYQAVGLQRSRCFRAGNLSCITCHDPHTDVRRDAVWYRDLCLSCHAGQKDRGDCLECHMARVSPMPHLVFTDHYIRVRAAGRE